VTTATDQRAARAAAAVDALRKFDALREDRRRHVLADLRRACAFAGIRAESPRDLDPEGERLAREERWT
jgi:hypothetical protein